MSNSVRYYCKGIVSPSNGRSVSVNCVHSPSRVFGSCGALPSSGRGVRSAGGMRYGPARLRCGFLHLGARRGTGGNSRRLFPPAPLCGNCCCSTLRIAVHRHSMRHYFKACLVLCQARALILGEMCPTQNASITPLTSLSHGSSLKLLTPKLFECCCCCRLLLYVWPLTTRNNQTFHV